MKSSIKLVAAGAALAVIAGAVALSRQEPRPLPGSRPLWKSATPSSEAPGAPAGTPADADSPDALSATEDATPLVRVSATEPLGEVNGVPIRLEDLVPLPKSEANGELAMSQARLQFLYDRAVDRELIFQTAQQENVKLSADQLQALEEARARRRAAAVGAFDAVQESAEQAEFEERDFKALLLQTALAERHGVPSRNVMPSHVQSYYDLHRDKYGPLPEDPAQRQAAWRKIDRDIRFLLAPLMQEEYDARLDVFWRELRGKARISHSPVIAQATAGAPADRPVAPGPGLD